MAVDLDKYKLLYEHHKNLFEQDIDRYRRLEDKAMKYLSAITLVIGAYLFLIRWAIEKVIPPSSCIEWLTVFSIVATLTGFAYSWSLIFRAIGLNELIKMPANASSIDYFKKNRLGTVYLGLGKRYSEGIKKVEKRYNSKVELVGRSYRAIKVTAVALIFSIFLILIKQWSL